MERVKKGSRGGIEGGGGARKGGRGGIGGGDG